MTISSLPLVIAGPMLRHCDLHNFTLWFVTSSPLNHLSLSISGNTFSLNHEHYHPIQLGQHAYQYLIHVTQPHLFSANHIIKYTLFDSEYGDIFHSINQLTYDNEEQLSFIIKPNIDNLLHGSCRNPHHHGDDTLIAADQQLNDTDIKNRPAVLLMTGDQIYVDDVAGPVLYAIGKVIKLLGLPSEQFTHAAIHNSNQLSYQPVAMYQRHKRLLPNTAYPATTALWHWYINHPIFSSSIADNHLISLSEIIALYLLIWSPELWHLIDIPKNVSGMPHNNQQRWLKEWKHIQLFINGLPKVRRLLAHIPTYMIFDDHDITDDWNLTAKWEQAAYNHDFSRRIIGNALIGYTLFQGLGNQPKHFNQTLLPIINKLFHKPTPKLNNEVQNTLIDALLTFEHWHYSLETSPKIVVLDTRTRRWRNETNLAKPSGLMDWEALMELQHELMNEPNVIIVSPTPMFGVKLIETIQRIATSIGGSLIVDAENWMAHQGSANTLLSIVTHRKTPQHFVILSGDVHYSFAYDVTVRFRNMSPQIYQITSSGIKNQFPEKLLPFFDKMNRWLYGHYSPLNLFTKRKRLSIRSRKPNGDPNIRLVNQAGIGKVSFANNGAPTKISILHGNMQETFFDDPKG